ncbi:MAG: hypothetical protein J5826_02990 [Bacteroidales bacterium]|nr:hypothetical protein [Bacteroidales bacterium]
MNKFKHILLVLACVFVSNFALGQNNNPSLPIPLDGGVSVLIAAGVGYAAKKYRDYRMNKKEDLHQNSK